ncbi:putative KHDC1-like protein [Octodon degus]|uniref:KHDC1-like protein n=1 Tax=Octodon degus TaxID=10160 RepID=A0A6P3FEP9_OCTDE|nr:putative KHDC1-like protein [Octodon degus]
METGSRDEGRAWWMEPEHFHRPLVFFVDAEQEELVFGRSDADLRRLEEHSHTLIQLEAWATPEGHTRVTVVGPPGELRWLQELVRSVGSAEPRERARALVLLGRVRRGPLCPGDLVAVARGQPLPADPDLATRLSGPVSLPLLQGVLLLWSGCSAFWSSLCP